MRRRKRRRCARLGRRSGSILATRRCWAGLRDYVTGTNYRVTPVLALLSPGFIARPSAHEVAAVFQLPLGVLLDPEAPQRRQAEFRGRMRSFWVWPHPEHYVWGATAAMLVHLARRLRGEV